MRRLVLVLSLLTLSACAPALAVNEDEGASAEGNLGYARSSESRTARFALSAEQPESVFKYSCLYERGNCQVTLRVRTTTPELLAQAAALPEAAPIAIRWAHKITNGSTLRAQDSFANAVFDWSSDDEGVAAPVTAYGAHEYFSIRRAPELSTELVPSIDGELTIESENVFE